jgi:hypothetical protein
MVAEQLQAHHPYRQYDKLCNADTILYVQVGGLYFQCVQAAHEYEYMEAALTSMWDNLPA